MENQICSNCKTEFSKNALFCPNCGTPVSKEKFCDECGTKIESNTKFCSSCGKPISSSSKVQESATTQERMHSRTIPEVETPQVTVPTITTAAGTPAKKNRSFIIVGIVALLAIIIAFVLLKPDAKEKEEELTKQSADVIGVEGPLRNYIKLVSDNANIEMIYESMYGITFSVQLEVVEACAIKGGYKNGNEQFGPALAFILLDENRVPVNYPSYGQGDNYTKPHIDVIASNLNSQGSVFWVQFLEFIATDIDKEKVGRMRDILKNVKYIQITSSIKGNVNIGETPDTTSQELSDENEQDPSLSDSTSTEDGSSNVSKIGDCEKFFKEYEEFVDDYIAMFKKYKNNPNDMSLMQDYTSMVTKASEWTAKIADCKDDKEFAERLIELQMKLTKGLSGL